MSDLKRKQIIFTKYLSHLLSQFYETDIVLGESWRSPETCALYEKEGKGISNSCHQVRLAQDLIVVRNGTPSNELSDYLPLALYWKQLPQIFPADIQIVTAWGGDFKTFSDPYHFSIEHNGTR